jgi:hypothetical protein
VIRFFCIYISVSLQIDTGFVMCDLRVLTEYFESRTTCSITWLLSMAMLVHFV